MNELKLSDIMQGLPGVSSVEGANIHENCMVEHHRYGHSSPTTLKVASDNNIDMNIVWEDGPGLSILYRSAASLALQCGKLREAERLVAKALSGNPPSEIAIELRDFLRQIYSEADKTNDVYEIKIPESQRSKIPTLLQQLGLSLNTIRKTIGRVAI